MRFLNKMCLAAALCVSIFMFCGYAHADASSDLLLKLLVKKGVVTEKEAEELKTEVGKMEAPPAGSAAARAEKSEWAERVKLKGDVRLRNEYEKRGTGSYVNRQRIRARAAIIGKISDTVEAGIGLASGGTGVGTSRSTNQTLSQAFSTKPIGLDLAYVDWKPAKEVRITGGKYDNPLYHPGDLLWDSDIRFEGVSTNLKYSLSDYGVPADAMVNAGVFPLDDLGVDKKNPYLYAVQGGVGSSCGDMADWKVFLGYLDFAHIKNTASASLVPTTARILDGKYGYDYNVLEVSGDVTLHYFEKEFLEPFDKPLTLFGDYANNLEDGSKRHAWQIGAKFGAHPKAFGEWSGEYNFRLLDSNSFPDDFPDADAFGGGTNGFAHEVIFAYGLAKNIFLEFDYYLNRDKSLAVSSRDKWSHLIQTDVNVKF